MAGFALRASRTGRYIYVMHLQNAQQHLAFTARERHVDNMRNVMLAIVFCPRESSSNASCQAVTQRLYFCIVFLHLLQTHAARLAKGGNVRHSFRARTHAALLSAAVHERRNARALFDIQRTNSLRRTDFMSADADEIRIPQLRLDGQTRQTLHGINVKQRLRGFFLENLAEFLDRQYCSDFVVCQHTRQQHGIRTNRLAQIRHGNVSVCIRL